MRLAADVQAKESDEAVPLLDLGPVHSSIDGELIEAVTRVLRSNRFIGGPEVQGFEQEAARYLGTAHAVGVSSGTDALIVSLMALGIGPGDEVIVPGFTFFATAGSVWRLGATPVFADMDEETFNVTAEEVERLITPRTRAVIPVHLFGQAADMDGINDLCRSRGIAVVEDAAQAIGAEYGGKRVGSLGDVGCFSFFPSKNLGGIGDGGLVATNREDLAESIRSLRDHGATRRYYHSMVGGNFRLDAIQAAVLRVKLRKLEEWHEQRRDNATGYSEGFQELEKDGMMRVPREVPGRRHVFNQFVIRVRARDALQDYLASEKVGTAIYYPVPLHLQECFQSTTADVASLPRCEQAAGEVLALPIFPGLTVQQRNKVIRCVSAFLTR